LKKFLKKIYIFLCNIGLSPLKLINLVYIFNYFFSLVEFLLKGGKIKKIFIILGDHKEKSGVIDRHYFLQDINIANKIFVNKPIKHVDIGSRLDGFISHLASFRKVEVFDIRKNILNHPNIVFNQLDITKQLNDNMYNYSDSVSCLHSIEHFGLGRYGDKIDPLGHIKGFKNLLNLIKKDGLLYISFPIAYKSSIEFNAHRIFEVKEIFNWSKNFELVNFDYIDDNGKLFLEQNINFHNKNLCYGCGMYVLKKL